MATGGIFALVTNDGRQDRMLMATALLNKRLDLITKARMRDSLTSDPTPSLADVEKTHIIFTNAHFKPFAAIGYEYNKVRTSAGSPELGQGIQFSLPQFGDFFHDMVMHVKLRQPTLVSTATNPSDAPAMRWCAYPGERLMAKVQFEVNGNPLDEYHRESYNFYREFQVGPHKIRGWNRCVGQEDVHKGFVDQANWAGSGVAPSADDHRFLSSVVNGAQTPSGQKDVTTAGDLEMFIPLLFWCNKDARLSVPSVAIPYGQRFINVQLAEQSELVNIVPRGSGTYANPNGYIDDSSNLIRTIELYVNNIFVNPEVHDIFIKRIGFNLIRVHRQQNLSTSSANDEVLLQQLKWPTECLFVGMKVKDYCSSNVALCAEHLDKWHTFSQVTNTSFAETGWTQSQERVVELEVDDAPALQAEAANAAVLATLVRGATDTTDFTTQLQAGDVLTVVLDAGATTPGTFTAAVSDVAAGLITLALTELDVATLLGGDNAGGAGVDISESLAFTRATSRTSTVAVCSATLDTLTIKAHGIPIYNDFPSGFYNAYLPFHFGGPNINTPQDCGAMMVTFCLYPGTYQPSGHINISRAREFYLEYSSSVIGDVDGLLVVVASAINFLLISDGSAVLRYST